MVREVIMLTEDDVKVNELASVIKIASIIMFRVFETGDQSAYFTVCFLFVSAGKRMYLQHCALRSTCLPLETLCIFVFFWLSHGSFVNVFPHRRGTF